MTPPTDKLSIVRRVASFGRAYALHLHGHYNIQTWFLKGARPRHFDTSPRLPRGFLTWPAAIDKPSSSTSGVAAAIGLGTLLIYSLDSTRSTRLGLSDDRNGRGGGGENTGGERQDGKLAHQQETNDQESDENAPFDSSNNFGRLACVTDIEWSKLSDWLADLMLPEWSKLIPSYMRRLQRELSFVPGSLAEKIWREAQDPAINPEIVYSAKVRVSNRLCDEEKVFLAHRKRVVAVSLAKYLDMDERDIHPDDVPIMAMCGSGGGLRALVAGVGSFQATAEDGLFDCMTYTSGVSGSCWLQSLYYSCITGCDFERLIHHLKARLGVHIANPAVALNTVVSAPTNKYLLSGIVEKRKGDSNADFGLVDIYGVLLAARLLVPKGELGVNEKDFKLSNQKEYMQYGQRPLPLYTAVRHEIPDLDSASSTGTGSVSEKVKEQAKQEAWFQWFEMSPYEVFCEEFAAGIPTWSLGRKFCNGQDVPTPDGLYQPEMRMPLLLGIYGSAFCAPLSHCYREIRPIVQKLSNFQGVDELIWGRNEDLSKVHPIDPATLPNFVYGMEGKLASTAPQNVMRSEYIQLMDAGMSNNIPIYPLLRPHRQLDIIIAFDASADVKTDNWLSVADGFARRRGIKGWPVGIGWPKPGVGAAKLSAQLGEVQVSSSAEAEFKLKQAQADQQTRRDMADAAAAGGETPKEEDNKFTPGSEADGELGYCTIWAGTRQERTANTSRIDSSHPQGWDPLLDHDAGMAVAYLPLLRNEVAAPGVDPSSSDYLSTWNFVYTPEQIDAVVGLARANYAEGRQKLKGMVRAVYERKKKLREVRDQRGREEQYRRELKREAKQRAGGGGVYLSLVKGCSAFRGRDR